MKQICLVDLSIGRRGYRDVHVLINPQLIWSSRQLTTRTEGCVNFPEWWGQTARPRRVKVQALDRSGHQLEMDLSGWAAALLCHEIDHLQGGLFIDRLVEPRKIQVVCPSDLPEYRRMRPVNWPHVIDAPNI